MLREKTLALLKPDAIERGLKASVHEELEKRGLRLVTSREILLTQEIILAWRDWPSYDDEFWIQVEWMTNNPVIVEIWEGEDAIELALEVKRAVREKYEESRMRNVLHCPDNHFEVEKEVSLFFSLP